MSFTIHPTAVVHRDAELSADVEIGPYCVVGEGVAIGAGTRLLSHVVVEGPTTLGGENIVHPFVALGGAPQSKRHDGTPARLTIGARNVFREHFTAHGGANGGITSIGDDNFFMASSHVAHDVTVGSHVVVANGTQLAGHSVVEDWVTFGGLSAIGQFVRVGESAFVAAGAMCERNVPPYVIVQGDRARARAINRVGLTRRSIEPESIAEIERVFRAVFFNSRPKRETLTSLATNDPRARRLIEALSAE